MYEMTETSCELPDEDKRRENRLEIWFQYITDSSRGTRQL